MLTKNDLSQIKTVVQDAIKPEIKALKKDMNGLETRLKDDVKGVETRLGDQMKKLESRLKSNMKDLETRLIERIDDAQMEIISIVDKHKADKEDVEILGKRTDRLEENAGLPPYADQ